MRLGLYQEVSLLYDAPEAHLIRGDVAVLVDYVPHPRDEEEGAALEVFNAVGESIAVVTVPASFIAALGRDQIPAVRALSLAA